MTEIEKLEQALEMLNAHKFCGACTTASVQKVASCTVCDRYILHKAVLTALREKLDRLKNPPLTVEELRQMVGQPVFVHLLRKIGDIESGWFLVIEMGGDIYLQDAKTFELYPEDTCEENYGIDYIAYRYKPEEELK